jgi:hypothetical protein
MGELHSSGATMTTETETPENFEYRNIGVRRIQRGVFSTGSGGPPSPHAWRARVDARGKSRSVSADSVMQIKEKIDAILDGDK